jgi:hypothetical protein
MPIVSPTFKIRCPYCRFEFHPSDAGIAYLNNVTASAQQVSPPPSPGSLRYYMSRFWVTELSGPKNMKSMTRRVCPQCKKPLPEEEIAETRNIAIVGDTSSGKTHYIAVLIDQLLRGNLTQGGYMSSPFVSLNGETDKKYRNDYYVPVLQEKNARQRGTLPGEFDLAGAPIPLEPLVYRLTLRNHQTGIAKSINLLFYDISGEDVADSARVVQFGEHILRADGIIYLADPVAMERIRQRLPGHLQPDPASITGRTAHEVLSRLMRRLENYQRISAGASIDVPTAIVISKSDLLRYAVPLSEQRNFIIFQPRIYDGRVYPQEFARIHQEVDTCLRFYGEQALLQDSGQFSRKNFFAISATGGPPDSNGLYIDINPLRCLDPFVWILWQLGYIEAA